MIARSRTSSSASFLSAAQIACSASRAPIAEPKARLTADFGGRVGAAESNQISGRAQRFGLRESKGRVLAYVCIPVVEHDGGRDVRAFVAAKHGEPEDGLLASLDARVGAGDASQRIARAVAPMIASAGNTSLLCLARSMSQRALSSSVTLPKSRIGVAASTARLEGVRTDSRYDRRRRIRPPYSQATIQSGSRAGPAPSYDEDCLGSSAIRLLTHFDSPRDFLAPISVAATHPTGATVAIRTDTSTTYLSPKRHVAVLSQLLEEACEVLCSFS